MPLQQAGKTRLCAGVLPTQGSLQAEIRNLFGRTRLKILQIDEIRVSLDEEEYRRWRGEADRALAGTRLQAESALHNWACFAAEQAAQLAVRGLLHLIGRAPWGHDDLLKLAGRLAQEGLAPSSDVHDALLRLSRHYIPPRYPDAHAAGQPGDHYGASDAAQALEDAGLVIGFCDEKWQILSSGNA